ncbi:MAG: exonuclease domain-containing protein [Candidatus Cohnella colombiensis]|uniref:Exonuclease domain-containing protein n=1 Tax=Candidatus Cohnella colombiensis TaxID=3121368 RepID=A0AA95EYN3_9BACL|nr:MAG: exonuclease domain-containing protein [Cohnella sp.]
MKQPPEDMNSLGRAWHLYKLGGLTPAIASMLGSTNAQQMAFIRSMSRVQRKESSLDILLADMEAVVFDLETTGFYPYNGDEILSIGAVRIRGGQFEDAEPFYRLVNPKRKVPQQITELTGITNEMAETAPQLMDGLHDFMDFVGTRVLIAHSSSHDKQFLNSALWRTSKVNLTHRILDTMMISKWLESDALYYGLDEVLERNGIEVTTRHHALHDSVMTAKLYIKFLQQVLDRQVTTLGDLYAYLSRR